MLMPISRSYISENFYIVKFKYFSRWHSKRRFGIFLIDHYVGDISNRNIAGTRYLSPTPYYVGLFTQGAISIIAWFKYFYYLSASNRDLLRNYYCYVLI